ncbi:DUF2520 domain-containing protein [Hymenobacter sp. BT186]|uniref:DUF2520 domain-containing protein n=1 Tax=Hymenobacter telluris TaxID=2816474 RepID=A0A939EWB2_9BACT|nr:Rossmann-like and DUF2520 domain-containing protein [Hymenobacter telluris]MBO0357757.1 DUF2520 domain-containing protein [Hymenobacter telluris]MBW3373784.1 DUF2520 domain-containing protein [Hymenobacter norwichensis]
MTPQQALPLRIILLGAGRVANQLGAALVQAAHQVSYVWSRTPASAAALVVHLPGTQVLPDLNLAALPPADVYLVAVPDAAIPEVLAQAQFPAGALVAHTSGTVPLTVFKEVPGIRGGVFYPLQTFSMGRNVNWRTVPLCIEATDAEAEATLLALAGTLSEQAQRVATPQRQAIHVAAVFACNFTNHLLGISHALLQEQQLPLTLLAPLLHETVEKALAFPPFTVQTGPAARHDAPTLARHRTALATYPNWLELYNKLTASIQLQQAKPGLNIEEASEL